MKCRNPECGAEVNSAGLFCGKCGVTVRSHCSQCNQPIPLRRGVKFCGNCATLVSEMGKKETKHVSPLSAPMSKPTPYRREHIPTHPSTIDSSLHLRSEPIYTGGGYASAGIAPADQLKTNRSLGMFILLTIVTFGIYPIYFFSKIGTDLNKIASRYDGKKTMHFCLVFFILTVLTFGIATLVWFHKMSERVGEELRRRGYEKTVGSDTYWLWGILGSLIIVGPFVYIYKLAGAMNTLASDYNSHG